MVGPSLRPDQINCWARWPGAVCLMQLKNGSASRLNLQRLASVKASGILTLRRCTHTAGGTISRFHRDSFYPLRKYSYLSLRVGCLSCRDLADINTAGFHPVPPLFAGHFSHVDMLVCFVNDLHSD